MLTSIIHGNGNVVLSWRISGATSGPDGSRLVSVAIVVVAPVVVSIMSAPRGDGSLLLLRWWLLLSNSRKLPSREFVIAEWSTTADEAGMVPDEEGTLLELELDDDWFIIAVPYSSWEVLILNSSGESRGWGWFEHRNWRHSRASSNWRTRSLSWKIFSCSCSAPASINLFF